LGRAYSKQNPNGRNPVIKDLTALQDKANAWKDVRDKQQLIQRNILFNFAQGGLTVNRLGDPLYNLVLVYAYAVLDEVLRQLREEGNFSSPRMGLGDLMHCSKTSLVPD
jgi:hypothetical protein